MTYTQLMSSLSHHGPSVEAQKEIEELRVAAKDLAVVIQGQTPEGRCKSLAYTKLEECLMWAVKGVVVPNG